MLADERAPPEVAISEEDREALKRAVEALEAPSFAARLSGVAGRPIELLGQALPQAVSETASRATQLALRRALPKESAVPFAESQFFTGAPTSISMHFRGNTRGNSRQKWNACSRVEASLRGPRSPSAQTSLEWNESGRIANHGMPVAQFMGESRFPKRDATSISLHSCRLRLRGVFVGAAVTSSRHVRRLQAS